MARFSLGKFLFPNSTRHARRRKLANLWLGLVVVVSSTLAAYLLHISGR